MNSAAREALQRLRDGNRQFVEGKFRDLGGSVSRGNVAQKPFAVILGCSDSRVPVEVVFNQGWGDLFVIRVAGNIVAPSQVGSIEFAVERFGIPLVVVLGHTHCTAVSTTLEELRRPGTPSRNLRSIVDRIRPAVQGLLTSELNEAKLLRAAILTNVSIAASSLRHSSSELLEQLVEEGKLLVVGAQYSLDTGQVEFFPEDLPPDCL
jgi:carbonic anhydrase